MANVQKTVDMVGSIPTTVSVGKQFTDNRDEVSRSVGIGSLDSAQALLYQGINHRGIGNPVPRNTDNVGITFFTRPRLNLSYDNLAMDRTLSTLLVNDEKSIQQIIRAYLDPDRQAGIGVSSRKGDEIIKSAFVDSKNPFITVLTNTITSLSGWPDVTVDTFSSKEGLFKEAWSMIDGNTKIYGLFELTANFQNPAGDPISLLLSVWTRYASMAYLGEVFPYPDSIAENEIDYQTRIYRLVLDPSRRFVQKIAACGAAFPTVNPLGAAFNYDANRHFTGENDEVSVTFRCMGAEYNDPITIKEFNDTVVMFNPNMRASNLKSKKGSMVQIPPEFILPMNNYGYPRIDPLTFELQWWLDKSTYNSLIPGWLKKEKK